MSTHAPPSAAPAAEDSPANAALRRLCEELLVAFDDYRCAPEDDHQRGQTAQLDAVMAAIVTMPRFFEVLSEIAPDGIAGIPLDLLPDPIRALLDQLDGLKDGHVGAMLTPATRRSGRPSLTMSERRHRARCVAAWRIFQLAGLSAKTATARIMKAREEVSSPEVLKQWMKDLREPEAGICRRYVAEAEERLQEWMFTDAQAISYADLLLRLLWS